MAVTASYTRKYLSVILWYFIKMSILTQSCYICSDDESLQTVFLPDETPVFVGRSVDTQITDIKCSKQQVWLYASYADKKVFVKQVGAHSSGFNGFKTTKNVKFIAKHGDCLEILYNKYRYRIEFNPPPEEKVDNISLKKRVHESSSENEEVESTKSENTKKSKLDTEENESNMKTYGAVGTYRQKGDTESSECTGGLKKPDVKTRGKVRTYLQKQYEKDDESTECTVGLKESRWEDIDRELLIYHSKGLEGRSKIAAYDMDGTLIKTKSGAVFPKDHHDWQILYSEVPGKLKKFYNDGYKIVIFTNQGFLSLGKWKPSDFKVKIEKIVNRLGIPIQVFIASGKNMYRKPMTGMWDSLINDKNDGVPVDKDSSFFVGDAAGRPKDWAPKKKKDHSSADRLLALNIGLKFETPEEHFLGHKPVQWTLPKFDPKNLNENANIVDPATATLMSDKQEVVILVGSPGSGKSHFANTHLYTYHRVNRDTLGNWKKCVQSLGQALSEGKSAVVDNTNPDPTVRQKYIDVAKEHGVPVRCFVMSTDLDHAKHNNKFRQLTDSSHDTINDAIIHAYIDTKSQLIWRCIRFVKLLLLLILRIYAHFLTSDEPYRKNFKQPTMDEGYTEIVNINFVPKYKNEKEKKLYRMYLLEK